MDFVIRNILYLICVCFLVTLFYSCSNINEKKVSPKLSGRLGSTTISQIQSAIPVTISRVKPKTKFSSPQELEVLGPVVQFSDSQRNALLNLLLEDNSYQFEFTKKCIFYPEFMIRFGADSKVILLFSPSCNQCKFYTSDGGILLDYGPSKESFADILSL